jgi:hypothetical protein
LSLAVENGLRMIYWARLVIPVSSFAAILTELCTLKPEVSRHFIKLAINVSPISPSLFKMANTLARNSSVGKRSKAIRVEKSGLKYKSF